MTSAVSPSAPWAERIADRSPAVRRARARQADHVEAVVGAARRLVAERGDGFTTQELVKEAGVSLQTFYRLFGSKDELLLAVFVRMIAEHCQYLEEATRSLPDPVARLRFCVEEPLESLVQSDNRVSPRFITSEHWRLYQQFPEEMSQATQPFADLVARQIEEATRAGMLTSADPRSDAWLVTKLVMAVFHHYAFAAAPDTDSQSIRERLWGFCQSALGGDRAGDSGGGDSNSRNVEGTT